MLKIITTILLCLQVLIFAYADDFNEILTDAQNGDARSQSLLSNYYDDQGDHEKALYWAQKAANQGYAYAYDQLGLLYITHFQSEENYQKAFKLFNKTLPAGGIITGIAQNELAYMYINGLGREKNYQKAYGLLTKAIQTFSPAYYNLGNLVYFGNVGKPNQKLGFEYYQKSAIEGYGEAQAKLAAFYWIGVNSVVDPNPPLSYAWNYLADQNGVSLTDAEKQEYEAYFAKDPLCKVVAYIDIGVFYMNGTGADKNYDKAFEWFQKAHELAPNLPIATLNVAKLYSMGHGTSQDFDKAVTLLTQAASQPFAPAQQILGLLYLQGDNHGFTGVDSIKAYAWLKLATYTYQHPDETTRYFKSFHSDCVGSYGDETKKIENANIANYYTKQAYDSLTNDQKKTAEALFEKLKAKQLAQKY